jgi:hypothetical protein
MKQLRKILGMGTMLLLGTAGSVLAQPDTILTDTTSANEGLIAEMSSQTQALSDYFSLPKILITLLIIALTYIFLRLVSGLLTVWGERTIRHRVTIKGFIPVVRIVVWIGAISFMIVAIFRPPMNADCGVEQLVARWAHNPKVVGSSPTPATKRKPCANCAGLFSFMASSLLERPWWEKVLNEQSESRLHLVKHPSMDSRVRHRRMSNTAPATKEDSSSELMGIFH